MNVAPTNGAISVQLLVSSPVRTAIMEIDIDAMVQNGRARWEMIRMSVEIKTPAAESWFIGSSVGLQLGLQVVFV